MSTAAADRGGQHLARRDRISRQQQMPAVVLEQSGAGHRALGHSLAPRHVRNRRDGVEVAQLHGLEGGPGARSDRRAHRGLAGAARTRDQQQHESILTGPATDFSAPSPFDP